MTNFDNKKKRNRRRCSVCMILVAAILPGLMSIASAATYIGKVSRLEGSADVLRGRGPAVDLAMENPVYGKDILRTRKRSLLEISMNDGSRITIGESTRLDIKEYLAGQKPRGMFDLMRGRVRAVVSNVFSKRKESFQIRTTTAVVGVQGTDFIVLAGAMETRIEVFEGVVSVKNTDPNVKARKILKAGQAATVRKGEPPLLTMPQHMKQFGSGGSLDILSGGTQSNAPTMITPKTSPGKAAPSLPPIPNPPGR